MNWNVESDERKWNVLHSRYPKIKTESFLTFLTSLLSLLFITSLISVYCPKFSVLFSLLDKSLTGPEMNTESFLSLRTFVMKYCFAIPYRLYLDFYLLTNCLTSFAFSLLFGLMDTEFCSK